MGTKKRSRNQPSTDDLCSLAEVAQLAGISQQRAERLLRQPGGLPAPEPRKGRGEPSWQREAVEQWCQLPVDAAGVPWRQHPDGSGYEPAPWLLTETEPDGSTVELFRGLRDVVTPQDGAVRTFTILWDTARGHVLYLVPLREMVAPTNELTSHAVAQFLAPRWRLAATALLPSAYFLGDEPSATVYRLYADQGTEGTEMVPPLLKASVLHPDLPSYIPDEVRRAARLLGVRIPVWMRGTETEDVATAALHSDSTLSVPDSTVWPAVEERLRRAVAASMPEQFPAAWTLLARDAAWRLADVRREHRSRADVGDYWYLVARPVEPAPPSQIVDAMDGGTKYKFDLDEAVDCLNRLRAANDELDVSDPLGMVYDCAIAQLDEWLFIEQLGARAGGGRGFAYQRKDYLGRKPDPATAMTVLAELRRTAVFAGQPAAATAELARELDVLELACHSSTGDTDRVERAVSALRAPLDDPETVSPEYRTLVGEVVAHISAVLSWRGAPDGELMTDVLRRRVTPARLVVRELWTGDTAAQWLHTMQQVPADERLLRSRRIRRLMPNAGPYRGDLYRDDAGRYVLMHQATRGPATFGAEWETSPHAVAAWNAGTTIVVDRSGAGRAGPPLVTTTLGDGTTRIDPLPLDPDVTRSCDFGDDRLTAQHLYAQLVHLALNSVAWSGLHLLDALLPVMVVEIGGRLREAILYTDGPLRLAWHDVQRWAVEDAEASVATLTNGWKDGLRYFAVRDLSKPSRYTMVVRTWSGADRRSSEEIFRHFKGVWERSDIIYRINFGHEFDDDYAEVNAADLRHFRRARHITSDCPLCGLVYSFTATRPVLY